MMKDMSLYWIIGLLMSFSGVVFPSVTVAPEGSTTSAHSKSAFFVCIKITNRIYSDLLNNPDSQEYIILRREVENVFDDTYSHAPEVQFTRISEITFSNGSVIANCTALFDTKQINGDIVRDLFVTNYKLLPSKMLELNITYTEDLEPLRTSFPVEFIGGSTTHIPTTSDSPSTHASSHSSTDSSTHSTTHTATESSTHSSPHTSTYPSTNSATHASTHSATHASTHASTHSSMNPFSHSSTHPSTNPFSTHSSKNPSVHPSIHSFTESPTHSSTHSPANSSSITASHSSTGPSHTVSEHITSSTLKNESYSSNGTTVHPVDNSTHNGTINGNNGEPTSSSAPTHSPTNPKKSEKPSGPEVSTTARSTTAGSAAEKSVPGWGVALLVLAAIILFLLLLLLILLLLCWCCWWRRRGFMNVTDADPPGYYNPDIPLYSTHSTFESYNGKSSDSDSEKPQKNRTGMYVVNK